MHARCDTDPLDIATDVCDQCGGEHCDDHLIRPYGPGRPPLCRACAMALSGVRSGGSPARKRSRSQIKKRRAELRREQDGRVTPVYEVLQYDADGAADAAEQQPALPVATDPAHSSPGHDSPGHDDPAGGSPADDRRRVRRLGLGRWRVGRAAPEPAAAPALSTEDLRPSVPGGGPPGPTPARTSATVLLTRLRDAGAVPGQLGPTGGVPQPPAPAGPAPAPRPRPPRPPLPAPLAAADLPGSAPSPGGGEPSGWPDLGPPGPVDRPAATLGSVFGRGATPFAASAVPVSEPPRSDDPWADAPPALRGPGDERPA